jgi:hypothetical protein
MNDHPAHAGDIVRRRRDRLIVTVTSVEPNIHLLHTTQARAMAAQLLAAAKYAESFCGGCDKAPCVCEPDQGGEYPCTNCGTTGWDCLTQMNSTPGERRCCHRCPYIDGHKRPARQEQS